MGQPFGAPLQPANDEASVIDSGTQVGTNDAPAWWEAEDAPAGTTQESLYSVDANGAKHAAGPTHYHHLADGRVVAGFGGGTLYSEPGPNGKGERLTRIIGVHAG